MRADSSAASSKHCANQNRLSCEYAGAQNINQNRLSCEYAGAQNRLSCEYAGAQNRLSCAYAGAQNKPLCEYARARTQRHLLRVREGAARTIRTTTS